MKTNSTRASRRLVALTGLVSLAACSAFAQTTRTWDANGATTGTGGTGTWDTSTAVFDNGTVTWNNTTNASDTVSFGGTAGTVTLSGVTAVRRLNVTVSGYSIGAGSVTSDQVSNSFWIQSTQSGAATVNTSATFSATGSPNIRVRTEQGGNAVVLNLGGDYQFSDASGTKRFDLEAINDTNTHTINFSGRLLTNATDTRLRIGNAGGAASTFNLSGASTYAGGTEILRGIVNASNASAFGTGGVTIGQGNTPAGATLRVNLVGAINFTNAFSTANGLGAVTAILGKTSSDATTSTISGNINLNSDTTSLTVDVGNAGGRVNVSGLVTDSTGTRALTKTGLGTLALTRSAGNTFDGGVTVSGGTLLVDNTTGSGTGTGAVSVASGAALGGDGIISGAVSFASGAKFVFSASQTLDVNGASVSFTSFGVADLLGLDATANLGSYTLIGGTSTISGTVLNQGLGGAYDLGSGKLAYFDISSNDLVLTVAAIPEPSSFAALAGLGALGLASSRRRRR